MAPIPAAAPTGQAPSVLIIDDDPAVIAALELLLAIHEIPAVSAASPEEALSAINDPSIALALQDMNFASDRTSGREGADLFRRIRRKRPALPVLLMTAWASLEMAVELVKEGASDYIAKPWDDEKLVAKIETLIPRSSALPGDADLCGLVCVSPAMREPLALALRVAPSDAPVLITGENGSGKDKLAEILHKNSRRAAEPFVRVDLGALPESLLEAELFGAEAGAYTGATRRRAGRFEAADRGTLFLDEIGNLPLAGQMKLLRVLQTGEFQRLGSSEPKKSDVRVVAATNLDLAHAIRAGAFREDLFFRLAVIEIRVPPLRERPEDVIALAEHFVAIHAGGSRELSEDAREALMGHAWPGNVRELGNRIQRAVLVGSGRVLTALDLGLDLASMERASRPPEKRAAASPDIEHSASPLGEPPLTSEERQKIEAALDEAGGVIAKAAADLGLSRQALYRKMRRLGLAVERRIKDA